MNAHALAVLQFASVLDVVAGYASSSLGAARVRALAPATSRERVERELGRVAAMRAIVSCDEGWIPAPIPDVDRALARLRIEGTRLDGRELQQAGVLLRSSRMTAEALRSTKRPAIALSVLAPLRERLHTNRKAEDEIERALDDDGSVRDDD